MPSRKKEPKKLSFEEALEELESMVETIESGDLPLEKLIANYEHGAALISHCESVLENARKRLELITLKSHPTSPEEPSSTSSTQQNDDEIRLF